MTDSNANHGVPFTKAHMSADAFMSLLTKAAQVPGVRIDREAFLSSALIHYCSAEQVARAIHLTPAQANISTSVISRAARASISFETSKVSALSAVAGLPGGIAMLGTIPADLTQYLAHVLRITQKLAYLYSWPDLFDNDDNNNIDDATRNTLVLFLGMMFGAQSAQGAIKTLSTKIAAELVRRLPQQALTKGFVYPVVKIVAKYMGVQMTKTLFAGGIAKAIPVSGAVLSGGLTFGVYSTQARRLQRHLASLPQQTQILR